MGMDIFSKSIQRAVIQIMESISIMKHSKNLETIKNQFDFLTSTAYSLNQLHSNPFYADNVDAGLENYQKKYPNSPPQSYQLALLSDPSSFGYFEFYCKTIANGMSRFTEEQFEQINILKREAAKAKRIVESIWTIISAEKELESKCPSSSAFPAAIDALEKMKGKLNTILQEGQLAY